MDVNLPALICVGLIVVIFVIPSWLYIEYTERKARRERDAAIQAGRNQPITIQPFINLGACIGSGTCVTACPEDVLKIIDGQAVAVNMSACVGHGLCVPACPVDAIELVFGSEKRGIDIPEVNGNFETNVPGLFVAGELGGMGLIANAAEQGLRAMEYALKGLNPTPGRHGVAIVGAGPAGIAAALMAKELQQNYVLLEQGEVGGAVLHFPRKKLVFTRPLELPLIGSIKLKSMLKEQLVDLFTDIIETAHLDIATQERVDAVDKLPDGGFSIKTARRTLEADRVILCLGRRGTPRTLRVPGEDSDKVAYSLLEPDHYEYDHILVVGGGDSAVEAACTLAEQPGNKVTLSYRGAKVNRPKVENLERLRESVRAGRVDLLLESNVREIGEDRVVIEQLGEQIVLANDYVFVFVGGVLPTEFLQKAGIRIRKHFGTRVEGFDEVAEAPAALAPASSAERTMRLDPEELEFLEPLELDESTGGERTVNLGAANPGLPDAFPDSLDRITVALPEGAQADATTRLAQGSPRPTADVDTLESSPPSQTPPANPRSSRLGLPTRPRPGEAPPAPDTGDPPTAPIDVETVDRPTLPGRVVASASPPMDDRLAFGQLPNPAAKPEVDEVPFNTGSLVNTSSTPVKAAMSTSRLAALLERARAKLLHGDVDASLRRWREALEAARAAKHRPGIGQATRGLAESLAVQGDLKGAISRLAEAEVVLRNGDAPDVYADVLALWAELDGALGNYARGMDRVETLLELVTREGLADHRATAAGLLAETMTRAGFDRDAGDAALQAVEFTGMPTPANAEVRERATRVLCNLERYAEAEQALSGLPDAVERILDDPIGARLALRARVVASTDQRQGRELAQQSLGRATPPHALRAARSRLDAALALQLADQPGAARAAIKRGLKAIRGLGARGAKLELLLAFHSVVPDHRVAEAAARSALQLMEPMPSHLKESFVSRPAVKEVMRRWNAANPSTPPE